MLGKIPSWLWAVLVCVVIYGAGVWRGLDVVTEEYEAKIAAMNATHAEEERARAEAVAAAEKNARERLAAETARVQGVLTGASGVANHCTGVDRRRYALH